MIDTLITAFTSSEFIAGAQLGILCAAVVGLLAAAVRRWIRPAPLAGLAIAGAALMAMPHVRTVPVQLWLGAGALAVAGLAAELPWPWRHWVVFPLAIPGAWMIAFETAIPGADWVRWAAFVTIATGATTAAAFDTTNRKKALGPILLTLTVLGAYTTLPDTEEVLVLAGAALPLVLVAFPYPLARLGGPGAAAGVGVFVWVVAWGGLGRETAIIGGLACLGLLLAEPPARWITGSSAVARRRIGFWMAVLLHTAVVLAAARVAGLQTNTFAGLFAGGTTLLLAWILAATLGTREHQPVEPSD